MGKHMSTCGAAFGGSKCDKCGCSKMSKDECAAMCDSLKCTPEEKEMCMSHYDKDGKFMMGHGDKACCAEKKACCSDMKDCKDMSKCKDISECKMHGKK